MPALMGRLRGLPSRPSVSWQLLLGVTRSRGVAQVMLRSAGHAAEHSPTPSMSSLPPTGSRQPIVILGGFLISPEAYEPMRGRLEQLSGQPVKLVAVGKPLWALTVFAFAWAWILDRVAAEVAELARSSPTGRVTLVGHSSGGVMLRLFLDEAPFQGRRYDGKALADTLVMLGSPHTALKATPLRQMVRQRLPGAFFAERVRYVSVAGDLELSSASPLARRMAPTAYRNSSGFAADQGDGLVPLSSALLAGSTFVLLPGVAHAAAFGPTWYGSPEVVEQWWRALLQSASATDDATA